LADLLDLVAEVDEALAESLSDVTVLNPYGVEVRYPGEVPDVTQQEADEAVRLARTTALAVALFLGRFVADDGT